MFIVYVYTFIISNLQTINTDELLYRLLNPHLPRNWIISETISAVANDGDSYPTFIILNTLVNDFFTFIAVVDVLIICIVCRYSVIILVIIHWNLSLHTNTSSNHAY